MKKTRFFLCVEKEEQWLNEMSEQGYNFIRKSGCTYEFEQAKEKSEYRYYVDIGRFFKNTEFVRFLENLNIKLISKNTMFYYYQVPKESSIESLYTDSKSKIFLYLKCMLWLFALAIINILILCDANGPYVFNISIPFVFNLTMLSAVAYTIIKYTRSIVYLVSKR